MLSTPGGGVLSRNLALLMLLMKVERVRETRYYGRQDENNGKQERIGNQYYH